MQSTKRLRIVLASEMVILAVRYIYLIGHNFSNTCTTGTLVGVIIGKFLKISDLMALIQAIR